MFLSIRSDTMILLIIVLLIFDTFGFKRFSYSQRVERRLLDNFGADSTTNITKLLESRQLISSSQPFVFNTEMVDYYANMKGLSLRPKSQGIFLTLEAYPVSSDVKIGYLHCFLRPLPRDTLHLESIQVRNRRQSFESTKKVRWSPESGLISFIMGSWALCWAREKGSKRAELLAINDSEQMNKILVRLYSSFGFKVVREVGDSLSTVPDQIVWGGTGTLMALDMGSFFEEWTSKFELMVRREEERHRNTTLSKPG